MTSMRAVTEREHMNGADFTYAAPERKKESQQDVISEERQKQVADFAKAQELLAQRDRGQALRGSMGPNAPSGGDWTFTRAEVLAVLKSRKALLADRPHFTEAVRELDALIDVFMRME